MDLILPRPSGVVGFMTSSNFLGSIKADVVPTVQRGAGRLTQALDLSSSSEQTHSERSVVPTVPGCVGIARMRYV